MAKEAQDAKKAAAILKRQERLDLQERKRAEVAERKAAQARGEKPPPRVVIPEPEAVHYDVLLADPWRDEGTTLTDAVALPFKDLIADDALMFMWSGRWRSCLNSLALLEAWGFDCRGAHDAGATTARDDDPYVREQHELILIGTRGKPAMPAERDARCRCSMHRHRVKAGTRTSSCFRSSRRCCRPPSASWCCRAGAVPLAHRDRWHMWDAQPKGNQKAA